MELKDEIPFEQLLEVIRHLPEDKMIQLKAELAIPTSPGIFTPKNKFQEVLLKAPVMNDIQYEANKHARIHFKKYLSLVTFSHTIFAMPFAFIGFFLAVTTTNHTFKWQQLVLMVLCMVFARNSAMAFNRYLDRDIDAINPRTKQRDIPAGRISPKAGLTFTIINCLLFIGATWFINPLCFYLSPVALLVVLGYSATKRFTALCHLVLGLGLSLAPIGAYLVVAGEFQWLPLFFSFAVLCWVSGFDIIYALQDEDFDRSQHLHSIPSYLGKVKALRLSTFLHVCSAAFIVIPIFITPVGVLYYAGIIFFCAMLIYQHLLVKPNDLSRVNFAFMTTNGIASVVFASLFLLDRVFVIHLWEHLGKI